jgi:hypothetical protein
MMTDLGFKSVLFSTVPLVSGLARTLTTIFSHRLFTIAHFIYFTD